MSGYSAAVPGSLRQRDSELCHMPVLAFREIDEHQVDAECSTFSKTKVATVSLYWTERIPISPSYFQPRVSGASSAWVDALPHRRF